MGIAMARMNWDRQRMDGKPKEDRWGGDDMGVNSDDYRVVTTTLRLVKEMAILVDLPKSSGGTTWLPRSLLHGADDLTLGRQSIGSPFTFRLREWKAEQLGWA